MRRMRIDLNTSSNEGMGQQFTGALDVGKDPVFEDALHKHESGCVSETTGTTASQLPPLKKPRTQQQQSKNSKPQKRERYEPLQAGWTDLGDKAIVGFWPTSTSPGNCSSNSDGSGSSLLPAVNKVEAEELFTALQASANWQQRSVRVMGRSVLQPRLIAYYADDQSLSYTYSGLTLQPEPFPELLQPFKQRLEAVAGTSFNTCLLNLYRSGQDHVSWHADDEPLYGNEPTIASISLGCRRTFLLRERGSSNGSSCIEPSKQRTLSCELGQGDVLVMKGTVQQRWLHCVPKRAGAGIGPRISLTFRKVLRPEAARARDATAAAANVAHTAVGGSGSVVQGKRLAGL